MNGGCLPPVNSFAAADGPCSRNGLVRGRGHVLKSGALAEALDTSSSAAPTQASAQGVCILLSFSTPSEMPGLLLPCLGACPCLRASVPIAPKEASSGSRWGWARGLSEPAARVPCPWSLRALLTLVFMKGTAAKAACLL